MFTHTLRGLPGPRLAISALLLTCTVAVAADPQERQERPGDRLVRKIQSSNERMELIVNSSRILTLDQKILQYQVNNPDLMDLTPLAPDQIQLHAKKAGVTQVNLWDKDKNVYSIDVLILGDAEELSVHLRQLFPKATIRVIPMANGALLDGYVDQPEHVSRIIQIAEEFYPKVISNITVGGVQQVLLHVKVMEVSRTKMRSLGFDWAKMTSQNLVISGVSQLLTGVADPTGSVGPRAVTSSDTTFAFRVIDGSSAFFGVLEALRQDDLMKILAEPNLTTVSGRPAFFNCGGEFPILVPESMGTVAIEYKKYGTQVDFVPIVLGNGRIRLEVRPRVSEIDNSRTVTVSSITVPGLSVREVDTGVELSAGQTLAIAGLVQSRIEAQRRGMPWVGELPYLGALFRHVEERNNEVELLILVTPELVDAMDAHEVPRCGPGQETASPNDWQLFMRGHIEVPRCCENCGGNGCTQCGAGNGPAAGAVGPDGQPVPGTVPAGQPEPVLTPQPGPPQPGPAGLPPAARRPQGRQLAAAPASRRYDPSHRQNPSAGPVQTRSQPLPGFIGPIGYDAVK
jgi:pilus assembly protein CpaC